jgi:Cu/Ag efflux protein CusF
MRGMIRVAGTVLALCIPGLAAAEHGDDKDQGAQQDAQSGTIRGEVDRVNLAKGKVKIRDGDEVTTLHATPAQLAGIKPGDRIEVEYESYEGKKWYVPETRGRADAEDTFGEKGQLTGAIEQVDLDDGTIRVRGEMYRLHPSQVEDLEAGQQVNVSYAEVGSEAWVTEIEPVEQQGALTPSESPQEGAPLEQPPEGVQSPQDVENAPQQSAQNEMPVQEGQGQQEMPGQEGVQGQQALEAQQQQQAQEAPQDIPQNTQDTQGNVDVDNTQGDLQDNEQGQMPGLQEQPATEPQSGTPSQDVQPQTQPDGNQPSDIQMQSDETQQEMQDLERDTQQQYQQTPEAVERERHQLERELQ